MATKDIDSITDASSGIGGLEEGKDTGAVIQTQDFSNVAPPKPAAKPLSDSQPSPENPATNNDSIFDGASALDKLAGESTIKDKPEDDKEEGTPSTEEEKSKEDKSSDAAPKVEQKPVEQEPNDKFATIKLPPYSKPASVQAFNQVKQAARTEIAALTKQLEEVKAKVPAAGNLPVEIQKELEDLRKFRTAHDYQGTKEFQDTYVAPLAKNEERIYAKLKANGFTDEHVKQIKTIGLKNVDWDTALKSSPSTVKNSINAILLENEGIEEKREEALTKAKTNPTEFEEKNKAATAAKQKEESTGIRTKASGILEKGGYLKKQEIPVDASPEKRNEIEALNKFTDEQNSRFEVLLDDRSPETHAELVAGMVLAYDFKRRADSFEKLYKEVKGRLDRIDKSSSTARVQKGSPSPGEIKGKASSVHEDTGSALDRLRDEKLAAQ